MAYVRNVGALLITVLALLCGHTALAATFTVTKAADTNDGTCDADCSLREAIAAANVNPSPDDVVVPAGTYLMQTGRLRITDDLTINGAGADTTIIDGNADDRVISVSSVTVEISDVTIQNGEATVAVGAAIGSSGTLTVSNSTIRGNFSAGPAQFIGDSFRASIRSHGTLTVTNSTISGNRGENNGGGGISNSGTLTVTNSTISGNTGGPGILIASGPLTITSSTISGNGGTGVHFIGDSGSLANTIVVGNFPDNCTGDSLTSNGNNLDDDGSCGFTQPGDLSNVADPGLGPLANNGGPTETHALLIDSPAIDAADPNRCPLLDQRGQPRADGDGDSIVICDIGAFEASEGPCGNGILNLGEACDDGNLSLGDGCTASCQCEAICGDGQVDPNPQCGEECDDGNNDDEDGCSSLCVVEFCGDSLQQPGLSEQCDDGNNDDGDGCSANCLVETPQDKGQQSCINNLNKGAGKVMKAQGGEISSCLKNASRERLLGTLEECLTDDNKGKVQKARAKLNDKVGPGSGCDGANAPDFGFSSATTAGQASIDKELRLVRSIFGSDLDSTGVIVTDKAGSKCQQAVWKAAQKCQDTKIKVFGSCKKNELAGKNLSETPVETFQQLQDACLGVGSAGMPDPSNKLAGKCLGGIQKAIDKRCLGLDTAALFPGCDGPVNVACVDAFVECEVCEALNEIDVLSRDCDLFDDGVANGSCP